MEGEVHNFVSSVTLTLNNLLILVVPFSSKPIIGPIIHPLLGQVNNKYPSTSPGCHKIVHTSKKLLRIRPLCDKKTLKDYFEMRRIGFLVLFGKLKALEELGELVGVI